MFKQIHKLNRGTNFHLHKSCDSVGICCRLIMGLFSVHFDSRSVLRLLDFIRYWSAWLWPCTRRAQVGGLYLCLLQLWDLRSPCKSSLQLLCHAGGWERHSAHAPTPICLENRQFHLPPASSFRNSLCQPMTALWGDQIEQSPGLGVQKTVLPWSLPPGTYALLGGSCIFLCLSCFQSSEGCCGHSNGNTLDPVKCNAIVNLRRYASMRSKLPQLGTRAWQVENQSWADTLELFSLKEGLTDREAPGISVRKRAWWRDPRLMLWQITTLQAQPPLLPMLPVSWQAGMSLHCGKGVTLPESRASCLSLCPNPVWPPAVKYTKEIVFRSVFPFKSQISTLFAQLYTLNITVN